MKYTLTLIVGICLTGCADVKTVGGLKLTRFNPVFNGKIGEITITETSTNGVTTSIHMRGYQSDSAQAIEAVAKGVAEGLKSTP